jgi:NAD-dependent SIR2 family protein deacetylase
MLFRNHYRCKQCGWHWTDDWPAQSDDDCPKCGARHMQPYKSDDIVDKSRSTAIAELNDAFRTTFSGGTVIMTPGVADLPDMVKAAALQAVAEFNDFSPKSDPCGEHDFGSFELCSRKFLFRIDYHDPDCKMGLGDPLDPSKTSRILTLMLAAEC